MRGRDLNLRPLVYEPDGIWRFSANEWGWWTDGGQVFGPNTMVETWWTNRKTKIRPSKHAQFHILFFTALNMLVFIHQSYPRGQLQIKDEFHSHHLFLEIDVPDCWHNQLATLSPEAQ